jgi:hypothetical protein
MAAKVQAPGKRKSGGAGWVVLGALALGAFVGVESGWAGFGWAQVKAGVFPRDEALLGWVPDGTSALVIVDPHQLKLDALGGPGSTARTALERTRDDVKKATGIDLAFDVDKLVISSALVVARGRFDSKKLAERLDAHRYAKAEHKGTVYLVRAGEDAIAVVDDGLLLYGDESSIKSAVDAHLGGTSLEKNEATTARLRQIGWDHPLVVSVRITDEKPSLREILAGSTGPRAVSVSATAVSGLDLDGVVESSSGGSADELAKLLEEKRKNAEALGPSVGVAAGATPILLDVAKKATITADRATGAVKIHVHLDPAQLEALGKEAKTALPLAEIYKNVRLYQLLVPGL